MRFLLSFLAALTAVSGLAELSAADKPNIVIVITDDQGYGDLSCHGNPTLKTPNIDKLHSESVRLLDYHVAPTCSPTRAAFLTGHWTNRTGVWHTIMGRSMLRENEVTMGQIFKDAGYATGMFGKWHLGDNYPFRPEDRGFDEVMRHGGGGVGQTPDFWDNAYFDGSYFHNSKPESVKGFCTDVWFDYAKKFIKSQKKAGKPFLTYIATNAPHGPMHAPPSFSKPYEKLGVGTANFFGDQVFNAGMRGKKGSPYDGGHRVPFFMHWPKGNLTEGRDVKPITAYVDVVPTLIDLCEVAAPKNVKFDGMSIKSLLYGVQKETWPDRILVTDSQRVKDPIKWRQSAVMTSRWRLNNGNELYDMDIDPGQKKNVAASNPKVVERLTKFYDDWWAELLPTFKQDVAIHLGADSGNPATLTCHDWITTGSTPWNQSHVRAALTGKANTGFWNVNVVQDGKYEVRVRRWPVESGAAIDQELPPGADVPGQTPYRAKPGKAVPAVRATLTIGDETWESDRISSGDHETVFNVSLKAGKTRLSSLFITADGTEYGGYYAYVKRLN